MKTLDEVIKAFEVCMSEFEDCIGCPYANETGEPLCGGDDKEDALHYLKSYKKDQEDPDGDHQQLIKAQKLLGEFFQNDPLTWDELKEMVGKPVWVEEPAFFGSRWAIISGFNEEAVFGTSVGSQVFFCRDRQGVEWQAYRKERE